MVELRKITKENCGECFRLKVKEDQKHFVATNIASLAQAWVWYENAKPFAIYADDIMVGFTMLYVPTEDDDDFYVWRFMIDEKFQNRGYGREAMRLVLEYLKQFNPKEIFLSFEPENELAKKLYQSFGFVETGKIDGGELEMILKL